MCPYHSRPTSERADLPHGQTLRIFFFFLQSLSIDLLPAGDIQMHHMCNGTIGKPALSETSMRSKTDPKAAVFTIQLKQ